MASIERRRTKAGIVYDVRYRDPDERPRKKTYPTKRLAEQFRSTVEADKLRGVWVDPMGGRQPFRDYAVLWQAGQVQHRPGTVAQVDSHLRNNMLPRFGGRQLASIRPSEVQAWVSELSTRLAPATVEVVYRYFAAIMRAAVTDRMLASSPCVGVNLPKIERSSIVPLETGAVLRLVQVLPERFRALVMVGAGLGIREGEAFGLSVDRVDFLGRFVDVDRQLIVVKGAPPTFGPLKTDASRRRVPLPTTVGEALAAHIAEFPPGEHGLIFTNERGRPMRRNRFG